MVFGYLGYLLFRGYFERSFLAITLSVLVAVVYGSLLFGLLPTVPHISWEGHLCGFISGGLAARWLTQKNEICELADLGSLQNRGRIIK